MYQRKRKINLVVAYYKKTRGCLTKEIMQYDDMSVRNACSLDQNSKQ